MAFDDLSDIVGELSHLPSSLGGRYSHLTVEGTDRVIEALEAVKSNFVMECAMQSKLAAQAIYKHAVHLVPKKSGALERSGNVVDADVLAAPAIKGINWPQGEDVGTFTFRQKQRTVYWVTFGDDDVDYAALIHDNPEGWTIHQDVNPNAEDHYLSKAFNEYKDTFSRRLIDRLQAQVRKAGAGAFATAPARPVYTDEVPF